MKTLTSSFVALLLSCLATSTLLGQATVQGSVLDSVTNDPLIGANAFLVGTALGSVTDREGKYQIVRVPEGTHTLRISYIGYQPREIPVTVKGDEIKVIDARLVAYVIEGSEVVVTGQLRGQVAAINQQITSNTIINVVSEEKIKELPDANAAEAIGRLPGVSIIRSGGEATQVVLRGLSSKFSNITLDGVKVPPTDPLSRDVDLSTISQGALAGVELFKALTPDKDADAIAGSVNLVTKKAPSERSVRLTTKGGYNALMKSAKQYDVLGQYGERFLDDMLGVQVTGNLENRIRSNEQIDDDYGYLRQNTDYEINNFKLTFIDEIRKRSGIGVLFDVNTPDEGSVKFNNIYNKTSRDYLTYQRNYPVTGADLVYSARHRKQDVSTFNSALHGTNNILSSELTWGVSFAQSKTETPFDYYLDFLEPSSTTSGMKAGVPSLRDRPELLIPFAWNNYVAATCSSGYAQAQAALDKEKTANIDFEHKYILGTLFSGSAKIGGKYREKQRTMTNSQTYAPYYLGYWKEYNADGSMKALAGTRFDRFYQDFLRTGNRLPLADDFLDHPDAPSRDIFGKYALTPLINRDALDLWYELNINGRNPTGGSLANEYYPDPTYAVNDYAVTERVAAGYVMNRLDFGRDITFIAGVRVEREDNDYRSNYLPTELTGFPITGRVADTSASHAETIWLPNFHLTVRPSDNMSVRFAAYRALARPDFDLRLEKYAAQRSGATSTLQLGNSHLRTSKAWNYEVNTSIFGNEIGLVSISAYYKVIDDFVHDLNAIFVTGDSLYRSFGIDWRAPSFASGGYALTAPYNSTKPTKVWGLEFEHQMNFGFLSGFLQHAVLSYNLSLSRSETFLINSTTRKDSSIVIGPRGDTLKTYSFTPVIGETKQRTEGQPELFGNVALGYDLGGFSIRLSVFYQGEYNLSFSPTGESDQIVNSFTRWDLALKYDITDNVSILSSINNLTNVYEGTTQANRRQGWNLLNTQNTFGLTADFGVRITL
ncbi:MAG: TonB-dependent receptor [Bacteroidota bacterium]